MPVGRRSTTVCASVRADEYSRFLATLPAASAPATPMSRMTAPARRSRGLVVAVPLPSGEIPRQIRTDHHQGDHRQQRQIHASFRADLGGDRDDARRRGQRDEEPDAEKPEHRLPPHRDRSRDQQEDDQAGVRHHVAQSQRERPSIEHHQRSWPDRETQIPGDHQGLVQQIRPRRDTRRQASDGGAWPGPVQRRPARATWPPGPVYIHLLARNPCFSNT